MAALRTGAELVYVFTAEEAALPIKSYSPELMVTSVYSRDLNCRSSVLRWLDWIDAVQGLVKFSSWNLNKVCI